VTRRCSASTSPFGWNSDSDRSLHRTWYTEKTIRMMAHSPIFDRPQLWWSSRIQQLIRRSHWESACQVPASYSSSSSSAMSKTVTPSSSLKSHFVAFDWTVEPS
jgi:hypothetical protein